MDENRPVNVNFPSKMKVESPEIDSINKTAQRVSNMLHKNMTEIVKPLQILFQLPKILADMKAKMVEQFQLMFSNQIEAEALSRKANIRANEQKVKLVNEHISKKQNQIREAKERITKRYANVSQRLEKQHSEYLNQLDSHVYNITDTVYPKQVEEKFSFSTIPAQHIMMNHAMESVISRTMCLGDGFKRVKEKIINFFHMRQEFHNQIDNVLVDIVTEGDYEIPFWFAEVEDRETGKRRVEIFFRWEFEKSECPLTDNEKISLIDNARLYAHELPHMPMSNNDRSRLAELLDLNSNLSEDEIQNALSDCGHIFVE
jgi:hypothetical protein